MVEGEGDDVWLVVLMPLTYKQYCEERWKVGFNQ